MLIHINGRAPLSLTIRFYQQKTFSPHINGDFNDEMKYRIKACQRTEGIACSAHA